MLVIAIVVIIFLIVRIENLKADIFKLKQEQKPNKKMNFCPKCGTSLNEIPERPSGPIAAKVEEAKPIVPEKRKPQFNETEIKNSAILSVGAILVVIAAIVFLTTTWDTSMDSIKTLVISLMFFVFLGASYIAKNVLNIKQTAKVFLYIAFSYLPLVFLSISLFRMFGDYLSFYGEGKYIYLCISSILIAAIYYYQMKQENDIFFSAGSFIFQIISIILFVLIFDNDINLILTGIGCYSLLFHILYIKKQYYFNEKTHKTINQTIGVALLVATLYFSFFAYEIIPVSISYIALLLTIYGNLFYYLRYEVEREDIFRIVSPLLILYIFLNIANLTSDSFLIKQLFCLVGITTNCLISLVLYKKLTLETYIFSGLAILVLYLQSFIETVGIDSYLWFATFILLSYIMRYEYKENEYYKKSISQIILVSLHVFLLDLFLSSSLSITVLPVLYIIVFVVGNVIKENDTTKALSVVNPAFTAISFVIALIDNAQHYKAFSVLALTIAVSYYIIYYLKDKKILKTLSYIWILVSIALGINFITEEVQYLSYVIPIAGMITFGIEYYLTKPEDRRYEFLLIEFILGFISLIAIEEVSALFIYAPLMILFVFHNIKWNKSDNLYYIPVVSFIFHLSHQQYDWNIAIAYLVTVILLGYLYVSDKKEYIGLSLANTVLLIILFDMNKYLSVVTLIISAILYMIKDEKNSDFFKGCVYILFTIFAKMLFTDWNWNHITVLNIGILMLPLILITRTILAKNNNPDFKVIEYIGLVIINLLAISNYADEADGMIFVLLLLILTIFGYMKRLGPVFLTSLVFILINVFILTRVFWLSLPWWIYILLVGCILIGFAVRNEMKEKNTDSNILKDVAKKMDL